MTTSPSTWNQRLVIAKKKGRFTPQDLILASKYNTCALGERFGIKEDSCSFVRITLGKRAEKLADCFLVAVEEQDVKSAIKLYKMIQKLRGKKFQ